MLPRTYKASAQTKNNILQKAIELFNELGTASVSANALAEALGISAGNLQYHYKNKDEIIRAILEVMFKQFDTAYQPAPGPFTLETLRRMMRFNLEIIWQYRFFYRELGALMRHDPALASRFREIQAKRLTDQETLVKRLASAGGVQIALSSDELHRVFMVGWVLAHTWLPYVESMGQEINETALDEAAEMLVQHYKPYFGDLL